MENKVPASITSWITTQINLIRYGSVTVHFVIHEGRVQYITKNLEDKSKPE